MENVQLHAIFPQEPMAELTDVLKREHEVAEICLLCLREFNDHETICNLKYWIPDHIPIVFYKLSGYDAHLFTKELGKSFNKNDGGVCRK